MSNKSEFESISNINIEHDIISKNFIIKIIYSNGLNECKNISENDFNELKSFKDIFYY